MKVDATAKALRIIRDNDIHSPKLFAWLMWPDNPGWRRNSNAGTHGSRYGCGMWRAAGGFLGKLKARGLITKWYREDIGQNIHLTIEGEKYLVNHQEAL